MDAEAESESDVEAVPSVKAAAASNQPAPQAKPVATSAATVEPSSPPTFVPPTSVQAAIPAAAAKTAAPPPAAKATMSAPAANVKAAKVAPAVHKEIPRAALRPKQQAKDKLVSMTELADPDSLESALADEPLRSKPLGDADVLVSFETSIASNPISTRKDAERARGVADEMEDLLAPEELHLADDSASLKIAAPKVAPGSVTPQSVPSPASTPATPAPSATVASPPDAEPGGFQLQLIPDEPIVEPKKAAGH